MELHHRRIGVWVAIAVWPLLFELGARVDDWVRFRTPLVSPFHSQGELMIRDIDGMHGRPSARFQKWVLNSHGMRGPEFPVTPAESSFRIATVGASETFGLYEGPNKEYPRQLEDSLEAMRRDGRCQCRAIKRFEVINAAILGMSLPTVAQDIRIRLKRYSPRLVILYTSPAQYLEENLPVPAVPDSSIARNAPPPATGALYPRSLSRAREQLKLATPLPVMDLLRRLATSSELRDRDSNWVFRQIPSERMDAFRADLARAVDAVREIGARPILVSHANAFPPGKPRDPQMLIAWRRFYPRATADVIVGFDDAAALATKEVAGRDSTLYLDWHASVQGLARSPFKDFAHFNDWGSGVIAGELARLVVRSIDAGAQQ